MYSKRHKFRPKMRQNAFGGQAPPGPARWGSFSAPPYPLAAIGGCLLLRREEREREKGRKAMERGKQEKERQGKGLSSFTYGVTVDYA